MEKLLTVAEAAHLTRLSPATWRAWILQQKVTVVRLGRSVRVPIEEVDRLILKGTSPAIAERLGFSRHVSRQGRDPGEPQ